MREKPNRDSLQNYLDQIQEAFLVAHKAFQEAAQTKVGEILKELSPDHFEASEGGWLKFGPFRKAELFEIYKEKFQACKSWFESGRFMEELLREFEKTCQKLYNADQRKKNEKIYKTLLFLSAIILLSSCAPVPPVPPVPATVVVPPKWDYEKDAIRLHLKSDPQINLYQGSSSYPCFLRLSSKRSQCL